MKMQRFYIRAPMLNGLPDVSGVDHATLDGGRGSPWFEEWAPTDNTVSPISYVDFFTGETVSVDVPVRDDNFIVYTYNLSPAIAGRVPGFSYCATTAVYTANGSQWTNGLLFVSVEDGGSIDPAVAAAFGGLLSAQTILAVETDGVWSPSGVVSINENFVVIA